MPGTGLKVVWYAGAVLWILKPTLVFRLAPAEKLLWKFFMMNDPVAETDRCFPCLKTCTGLSDMENIDLLSQLDHSS